MEKKVEVHILNQPFTFIGEDEDRIKTVAQDVDDRIYRVVNDYGIVNTMNAVIMAMMELTDEYFQIKEHAERFEGRTLKLLKRVEEL
jgi:cell division protein ZapA (FtsZ GTPase activity inhibitor)